YCGGAQGGDVDLVLGGAVGDECFAGVAGALGDVRDGLEGVSLCDFDVAGLGLGDHTGISHISRINAPCSAWQKHQGQRYAGTHCRINTFTLAQSLFSVEDDSNPDTSLLCINEESLKNVPKEILNSG